MKAPRPSPLLPPLLLCALLALVPEARAQSSADEQYRFLAGLVDKGMHDLAVREAREFLRQYPQHEKAALVRYRLAGALWELDQHAEAAREYETLARNAGFEYRAECLFRVGEAARAGNDEPRARKAFEGVLAAGQGYLVAPALFALGELDFQARRFDAAEQRYAELLRSQTNSDEAPLARRALAWCAWERGDAPETVRRARAFLKDERDAGRRDELRLLLGEALLASDPKAALAAFRTLETPEQVEARARGEGFALAALGDHAGAAQAFEALLERAPEGRFAHEAALQAGIERLRAGDARAAVQRLALAAKDRAPETLYWLAQAQKKNDDAKAALASLEAALREKPPDELAGRIQVLRGDCLAALGRGAEALSAYEASGSDAALYAAAVAALDAGDADAAAGLAERILRARADGPNAQGARVVLAEAHFAAHRYPAAEQAFEEARKGAADAGEKTRLDSRLAWCSYLGGDVAAARERFTRLCETAPRAPEAEEALALLVRLASEQEGSAAARAPAERYLQRYADGRFADQAALALARASSGKEARQRFAQWLTQFSASPLRPAVLLELADLESAAGAHADAARHYAEVQGLVPGSNEAARAAYGQAWSAWETKDLVAAGGLLSELVHTQGLDEELRQAGYELLISVQLAGDALEPALATWHELCARKGDEKRRFEAARRILARLRETQQLDAAEALLSDCLRSLSTRSLAAEGLLEGTYLALDRADPARAEATLARARKAGASPAGVAEACYHVGEARLAAGDTTRALELFESAAAEGTEEPSPRAADALYSLGFVHLGRGELEPARQALAALLERFPTSERGPEARFLLAECSFRAERFEDAARQFLAVRSGAAAELAAKCLFRAGVALGHLERWSDSERALSELAQTFPSFPNLAESELWRGRALARQKKTRPARAAFERTLALDQGELAAAARLGLGGLAEAEGRADDALSEYLKVALLYAHEESVSEALFSAGRVLESQGDAARAAARYEELCAQHPHSPFVPRARERLSALSRTSAKDREK